MGELAGVFVALFAAHQIADHWVQTEMQARRKGDPGRTGRLFCLAHVGSYTAVSLVALTALFTIAGWQPSAVSLYTGLAVSAVTHYIADRRTLLRWLAERIGKRAFWTLGALRPGRDDNPSLGTGAYALDQSWHIGWLYVAALVIAA